MEGNNDDYSTVGNNGRLLHYCFKRFPSYEISVVLSERGMVSTKIEIAWHYSH